MKKLILFVICANFLISPIYSDNFEEYKAKQTKKIEEFKKKKAQTKKNYEQKQLLKYKKYKTKKQKEYDAYRRSVNKKFAEMMKKQWTMREKKAAVPVPKKKEPPKPYVKKDDRRAAAIQLSYSKIINAEFYEEPSPIAPVARMNTATNPIMQRNSGGDPIMQKNSGGDPIMMSAGGDPIMQKNSGGDPIMMSAGGDPIMQKNSGGDPIMASMTAKSYYNPYNFVYHGTTCKARFFDSMRFTLPDISEASIAEVWKKLSDEDFDILLSDCFDLKEDLRLGDWGYIEILRVMSEHFLGKESNESVLLQTYILAQSGYKVRLAKTDNKLILLVPFRTDLFTYPYFVLEDGKKYYILDKEALYQSRSYKILEQSFPREKTASLKMPGTPKLEQERGTQKLFQSNRYQDTFAEVMTNKNLIDFFNDYPVSNNWGDYSRASLSEGIKDSLYPALRAQINGKTKLEAANILLNFVQTAFKYMTDQEQFGYERPLFGDEIFYYPYSDCEDRSILFSILVRELLGLDVVLLKYPQHLATAVNFGDEDVYGSYFIIDGKKYLISDPTYIGAPVGEYMPQFKNTDAEIIKL